MRYSNVILIALLAIASIVKINRKWSSTVIFNPEVVILCDIKKKPFVRSVCAACVHHGGGVALPIVSSRFFFSRFWREKFSTSLSHADKFGRLKTTAVADQEERDVRVTQNTSVGRSIVVIVHTHTHTNVITHRHNYTHNHHRHIIIIIIIIICVVVL